MKEWNILVDYIDFYIYDKDSETVIISDSPEAGKAKEVYESFLEKYNIKNNRTLKWSFDSNIKGNAYFTDKKKSSAHFQHSSWL